MHSAIVQALKGTHSFQRREILLDTLVLMLYYDVSER